MVLWRAGSVRKPILQCIEVLENQPYEYIIAYWKHTFFHYFFQLPTNQPQLNFGCCDQNAFVCFFFAHTFLFISSFLFCHHVCFSIRDNIPRLNLLVGGFHFWSIVSDNKRGGATTTIIAKKITETREKKVYLNVVWSNWQNKHNLIFCQNISDGLDRLSLDSDNRTISFVSYAVCPASSDELPLPLLLLPLQWLLVDFVAIALGPINWTVQY